jgi:hypothetical protein
MYFDMSSQLVYSLCMFTDPDTDSFLASRLSLMKHNNRDLPISMGDFPLEIPLLQHCFIHSSAINVSICSDYWHFMFT